jgi:hypothetical protein
MKRLAQLLTRLAVSLVVMFLISDVLYSQTSGVVLRGRVTDLDTGAALVGIEVRACGVVVTDGNGDYSMTAQDLCNEASGDLTFDRPEGGYYRKRTTYTIINSPTILDVTLRPAVTVLRGTVTDAATQAGVAGAGVSLCLGTLSGTFCNLVSVFGITGSNGEYVTDTSFQNESQADQIENALTSGLKLWRVVASAAGYFRYEVDNNNTGTPIATLSPPFPATYNFSMSPTGEIRSITITTVPSGLGIMVDGITLVSPQRYDWTPSNAHTIATFSPQSGSAGTRYTFSGWSDGGAISHTIVVPNADSTYTANFSTEYELTTSVSPSAGGTITAGGWVGAGGQVLIQATANPGYNFTGFSGDLTGTTNPQNLTMNGPKTVLANFVPNATPAATTTTLTSSLNPSTFGQSVTFTATVSSSSGVPIGLVTFMDGAASIGTISLNASGQASLSTAALSVGNHTITAVYGGSLNFATSSSAPGTQTVNKAPSTTTIASTPNPSQLGQIVTFTATVSSTAGGVPTGTVTFREGTIDLGTASLNAAGQALFTTSTLTIGSHNVKAFYNGDTSYTGSNSGQVKQTINPITTTTTLTSTPNPSTVNQTVTFMAVVSSLTGAIPTGTVTFKDGNKTLGSAAVNGSGQANFSTSFSKKGTKKITAVFGGTTALAKSTSAIVNQQVVP